MHKFDICKHEREFHIDSDKSGGPGNKPRQSFYICQNCKHIISLQEKSSLDLLDMQSKSLQIQERQGKISMIANILSFIAILVAVFNFFLGEGIFR